MAQQHFIKVTHTATFFTVQGSQSCAGAGDEKRCRAQYLRARARKSVLAAPGLLGQPTLDDQVPQPRIRNQCL
jgi:hypothetical protein